MKISAWWVSAAVLIGSVSTGCAQEQPKVFATQEECEKTTGRPCNFQMCDYVPEGKTFEEVCGKDFKKGWVAGEKSADRTGEPDR